MQTSPSNPEPGFIRRIFFFFFKSVLFGEVVIFSCWVQESISTITLASTDTCSLQAVAMSTVRKKGKGKEMQEISVGNRRHFRERECKRNPVEHIGGAGMMKGCWKLFSYRLREEMYISKHMTESPTPFLRDGGCWKCAPVMNVKGKI